MNLKKNLFLGLGVLLFAQAPAWGYTLSPCLRVLTYAQGMPAQSAVRTLGKGCKAMKPHKRLAVHEHISAASLRKVSGIPHSDKWELRYMNADQWPAYGDPARSHAIIFGTWWNDDPLMLTLGQGPIFSMGGYKAWAALFREQDDYPAGAKGCRVNAEGHLGRQSHLGKLQHLHFMRPHDESNASADQHIKDTVDNALVWMRFTYQVATGEIAADAPISLQMERDLGLPSIANNFCVKQENVKVRTLFTRVSTDANIPARNQRTAEVALGSMLHVLQDSFAPAHACRVSRTVGTGNHAQLIDVDAYRLEDSDSHSLRDGYPDWFLTYLKSGDHVYENDPVAVGAWLIAAVDKKVAWSEVEKHLRETIFSSTKAVTGEKCLDGQPIPAR